MRRYGWAWMILSWSAVTAQKQDKVRPSMRDSLDGKFDVSAYLTEAHGFIPVPYILTEPALGGFGMAIVPIFINKNPPYQDSIKGQLVRTPVAPTITGGAAMYTLNNTWVLMGFRSGTLIKSRIKYIAGGGYVNMNMDFYHSFSHLGEQKLQFNIRMVPVIMQAIKRIGFSHWYAGLKYVFLKANARNTGDQIPDSLTQPLESDKLISALGGVVELDARDNIFTPDKGIKFHVDASRSDNIFGSDFDFWRMNYYGYGYLPVTDGHAGNGKLIAGLRLEGQQVSGDLPFYLKPYINMRGVPAERYQGNSTLLSELELRWDVVFRWSVIGFTGIGTGFDDWSELGSSSWVHSYGTGFRYLLAREFKLRVGVDVAHSPGTWAYYIVFGSNWLR